MEKELVEVLHQFGVAGLWGVVLYKLLDIIEVCIVMAGVYFGIKKAWKPFLDWISND